MRQHYTFRFARRPRRVNDRGEILGLCGLRRAIEIDRVGRDQVRPPQDVTGSATVVVDQHDVLQRGPLVAHLQLGDAETDERLRMWTTHFAAQGADAFTAQRRAIGALYHEVTLQAQLLAVADVFWLLLILFCSTLLLLPLLRRVRVGPARTTAAREDVHAALPVE